MQPSREWFTLVPGQVYLMVTAGDPSTDDPANMAQRYDEECAALIESSTASLVHFISDLRLMKTIPPIKSMSGMHFLRHPRLGYYITLGAEENHTLRFVATTVASMARLRYKDVPTLEDAYDLLLTKDPSLPPFENWTLPPETHASV